MNGKDIFSIALGHSSQRLISDIRFEGKTGTDGSGRDKSSRMKGKRQPPFSPAKQ
jgi:hypothetical protein